MTPEAGDAKAFGRRERRNQLHEAGAPALAGPAQSPADLAVPEGGKRNAALSRASRAVALPPERSGPGALADYELIELILFRAIPRRDVKPIAKSLIARFGSFAEVIAADSGGSLKSRA